MIHAPTGHSPLLPPRKWLALALSALCAAAPALQTLHLALVTHVECPDDGELVDVERPTPSGPTHAHESSGGAPLLSADRDAGAVGAGGHDHCAVVSGAHARARPTRTEVVAGPAYVDLVLTGMEVPWVGPRMVLYRVAPKASPPLV